MGDLQLMELLLTAASKTRRQPPPPDNPAGFCPPPGMGRGRILRTLHRFDGMTQTELANELNIRPQSLSEALCKLEGEGLIIRTVSDCDRRSTVVSLTKEGLADIEMHRARRESFAADYFAVLSDAEKDALFEILSKLTKEDKKL